jgi:hypothetical protein
MTTFDIFQRPRTRIAQVSSDDPKRAFLMALGNAALADPVVRRIVEGG